MYLNICPTCKSDNTYSIVLDGVYVCADCDAEWAHGDIPMLKRGDDPKVVEDNEEFKPYSISNTRSLWLVWNVPSIKPSKMAEKRLLTVKELKQLVNNLPTDIDHHTVTMSSKNYAGKWIAMEVGGVGLDDVNDELMFHGADYMLSIVQDGKVEED